MKLLILSVLLSSFYLVTCDHHTPGYYWRDFFGRLPEDALPVGKDRYVAQVLTHRSHVLVPAQFSMKSMHATYAYGGQFHLAKSNFKILATTDVNQFEWITTNNDDMQRMVAERELIPAGYDENYPLFVGKSLNGGYIGTVSINPVWSGLVYIDDNHMHHHDHEFQVLAYKVL